MTNNQPPKTPKSPNPQKQPANTPAKKANDAAPIKPSSPIKDTRKSPNK